MKSLILGIIDNEEYRLKFTRDNNKSKHMDDREGRLELSLDNVRQLYYYEVFRKRDNCRQVHSLYEDATLIIFNKRSGKVITVMLLNRKELASYLETTGETLSDYPAMRRCAKVHEELVNGDVNRLPEEHLAYLKHKKLRYMGG